MDGKPAQYLYSPVRSINPNRYTYPIFALLDTPQRIGLFTFSGFLVTVASASLKRVYSKLNGPFELEAKKTN